MATSRIPRKNSFRKRVLILTTVSNPASTVVALVPFSPTLSRTLSVQVLQVLTRLRVSAHSRAHSADFGALQCSMARVDGSSRWRSRWRDGWPWRVRLTLAAFIVTRPRGARRRAHRPSPPLAWRRVTHGESLSICVGGEYGTPRARRSETYQTRNALADS